MANTYVDVIKKDAVINVPFTTNDVSALQSILIKHLERKVSIDDKSWDVIEEICHRIDKCAKDQNLTESKSIEF